jgi:hypothetical protein
VAHKNQNSGPRNGNWHVVKACAVGMETGASTKPRFAPSPGIDTAVS